MNRTLYGAVALLFSLFVSCGGAVPKQASPASQASKSEHAASQTQPLIASLSPTYGAHLQAGDTVRISYTLGAGASVDSVVLRVRGERVGVVGAEGYLYRAPQDAPLGRVSYRLSAYGANQPQPQERFGEFALWAAEPPVRYTYRVVNTYPHDPNAYTQGLLYAGGHLYESTGLEGASSLREVELQSGRVVRQHNLESSLFGEGLELLDGKLYQLTWQNNRAFVYDLSTFEPLAEFGYSGEGWGLATDGELLYMSDGTEKIKVLDPENFRTLRTIEVYSERGAVHYLNEMEWIDGELWANVYTTNALVRIDPTTGAVRGVVDFTGLDSRTLRTPTTDVFNGIAYDRAGGRLFVTGKNWNKLFEVKILKR